MNNNFKPREFKPLKVNQGGVLAENNRGGQLKYKRPTYIDEPGQDRIDSPDLAMPEGQPTTKTIISN